jgi:hypothetical protein
VQFAHAGNNSLVGFFVGTHTEGRIFLRQSVQRNTHLLLVNLGLGLHGNVNNRLGENHAFEGNHFVDVTQSIARGRIFQTDSSSDIASAHFLELFPLIGVHLQNAAYTLFLAFHRVVNRITGFHDTRVNTEKNQLPDKGVGHDLEGQASEGLVVARRASSHFTIFKLARDRLHVGRRWHVLNHGIQHRLDTLVLEG